jgi:adenosylhomocysteine nucleosidase
MTRILVITALESELNAARAGGGVDVVYGGVGKINTAIATTTAILAVKPALIVNYGTCGKITPNLHGLLEVSQVVQRDMMAMPLAPRGVTPLCDHDQILTSGHGTVICGTGDSFVTATDPWLTENNIDVVDMELFAIAHVCKLFGVPWRAFKFITDDADDLAHEHWNANVAGGEDLFWDVLNREILDQARSTSRTASMSTI